MSLARLIGAFVILAGSALVACGEQASRSASLSRAERVFDRSATRACVIMRGVVHRGHPSDRAFMRVAPRGQEVKGIEALLQSVVPTLDRRTMLHVSLGGRAVLREPHQKFVTFVFLRSARRAAKVERLLEEGVIGALRVVRPDPYPGIGHRANVVFVMSPSFWYTTARIRREPVFACLRTG